MNRLKPALERARPGEWVLVEQSHWSRLGELFESLDGLELDLCTDVRRALQLPVGSSVVLMPRAQDLDWLERHQDSMAERGLRGVLFCDAAATLALRQRAPRLLGQVLLRLECPKRPPRFAVEGLRKALAARAPGVVWRGGALLDAFAAARPRSPLRILSAARPYAELWERVREHRHAWLAWTDVTSHVRLRRVRWVLAQTRHRTRAILIEPTLPSPGWWPVHGLQVEWEKARDYLFEQGATHPGRTAALNDFEPEALPLMAEYLHHGLDAGTVAHTLRFLAAPEGAGEAPARELSLSYAHSLFRGETAPPILRMFSPAQLRRRCLEQTALVTRKLEAGEPVETEDLASWTAWTTRSGGELSSRHLELAIELKLRERSEAPAHWAELARMAAEAGALDEAAFWEHWARGAREATPPAPRAPSAPRPVARLQEQARALASRGQWAEAESVLRQILILLERAVGAEHSLYAAALEELASLVHHQGRGSEAASLRRQAPAHLRRLLGIEWPLFTGPLAGVDALPLYIGAYEPSEQALQEELSRLEELLGARSALGARRLQALGLLVQARGELAHAEHLLRQAWEIQQGVLDSREPDLCVTLWTLGAVLVQQGRPHEGESLIAQALEMTSALHGPDHPDTARVLSLLAQSQDASGNPAAPATARRALDALTSSLGVDHPYAREVRPLLEAIQSVTSSAAG